MKSGTTFESNQSCSLRSSSTRRGLTPVSTRRSRPLGKDREVLIRFVAIDVLLAAALGGTALLDRTWLLAPLMALLFISLGLVFGMFNQLLSDPVG